MPDLRRQRRVVYHTKMRLRAPGREQSVVARVQNLSPTGVFVTANDLPAAGTEVLCRMLVAGERCTLRGLVAWVRPEGIEGAIDGDPGAGIQFVDVSDRAAALLAQLIQPVASDRQSVDVWFEGMSAPIKSHAAITDDALSISTKLPFLRLNSPVRVSFVRRGVEEQRSGILEAVTLEPSAEDGIPRLQLTVSTSLPDSAQGTIDVPEAAGFTPPEGMLVREPRTVVSPMSIETPAPVVVPQVVSASESSAPVLQPRLRDQEKTPRVVRASEPVTLVPVVPVPAPPPKHQSVPAKVAMGLVTLGVVGVLAYVITQKEPSASRVEKAAAISEAPRPHIESLPQPLATPPPEAKHPRPTVVPGEPTEKPAATELPSMAIALVGSAKGMQFYRLAEPPGLAINLPHGYPKSGATEHVPKDGAFKRLVIVRKGPGSQLRVYFTSEQFADVAAEPTGLRVILRARRAARKT
jgi:Tfp pilus assembly protein PilZ